MGWPHLLEIVAAANETEDLSKPKIQLWKEGHTHVRSFKQEERRAKMRDEGVLGRESSVGIKYPEHPVTQSWSLLPQALATTILTSLSMVSATLSPT